MEFSIPGLVPNSICKNSKTKGVSDLTGFIVKEKGDLSKTTKFLRRMLGWDYKKDLEKYGRQGVEALRAATPIDTGMTAVSWEFDVIQNEKGWTINWYNTNVNKHVNVALILQYGHATRNGGWVEGLDYINPALHPIFKELADAAWKEVRKRG